MTVPIIPTASSTSGSERPLTIRAYEIQARSTDQRADGASLAFTMLGLFGETGSLLSEVKKKQRDKVSYEGYADAVVEELGDVLWYLTALASRAQLSVTNIAFNVSRGYSDWHSGSAPGLAFSALQSSLTGIPSEPTPAFEKTLLKLAGEIGILAADYEAGRLNDNQAALAGRLVAVLRALVQAADQAGVTLEAAARVNLRKTFDRWPLDRIYPPPLDENAPEPERLPRELTIEIFEREVAGKRYVFQRCNGINIGDRLTDNAMTPNDYRFHDVFHYAYAAVLTWSPAIRSLFRLKRKSNPEVDDAEDGARAALIEEGIATWIFGQAKSLNFFTDMKSGELPFDLLKHVRQFVSGYEAARCPLWLWEDAILQGYEAFRFLKEKRRGRVHIDVINRRLSIEDLSV
jgi:NTP pyrophosphatase (non-canonical NTP hydrolase)